MTASTLDLIDVKDTGEGPPVVFVHGVLVNQRLYDGVAARLPGLRRIQPELPMGCHRRPMPADYPLSYRALADLVADLLEELDLEDVTLVGNDSGDYIVQRLITTRPERVGRVVLTSGEAFDNNPPTAFAPLVAGAKRAPEATMKATRLSLQSRLLRRSPLAYGWLAKHGLTDEILDAWVAPMDDPAVRRDAGKVLASIDKAHSLEAAAALPGFEKPVLLAWSKEDKFFPFAHAGRLAELLPDARVEPILDSLTFSALDQPQRLADLIADFVAPARDRQPQAAAQPR